MTRADTQIWTGMSANFRAGTQSGRLVKTSSAVYSFFIDSGSADLYYIKSTDGGFTWGVPVSIKAATVTQFSIWFDQWTPSDAGTKINIAYAETDVDDVFYRSLNTNGDTLGTEATVFAGASGLGNNASTCISITKSRGGNLYVAFDIDGGTETGFYRSTDGGVNWSSRTDMNEATSDYYLLFPGFAADNQDILCIFWDRSASEISRKIYDDSANSWAETSIVTSFTSVGSTSCVSQFSGCVDATNSRLVIVAWSNRDTANADLKTWWVTESAITAKTDVVTDSTDDQQMCSIGLATDTSTFYCFYGGKSDGSETVGTSINIYYKTSTDSGATWGSETLLTLSARNYNVLYTYMQFTGDFGMEALADIADPSTRVLYFSALLPTAGSPGGHPVVGSYIVR